MTTFSVNGLSSGIDYDSLISNMLTLERRPLDVLEVKESTCNSTVSAYGSLSTKLSSFQSAADTLRTSSNFYIKSASVSDSTLLDATASSSAAAGNYSIGVHSDAGKIALASEEKEVHSGVPSSTTVVNSSGADKSFQYTYAGTQQDISVADGTTLEDLRDLINNDASNPGVTATILNDGSDYRLILTGDDTGSAKTITIDAGTTLDGTGGTENFTSTTFKEKKSAGDAKFSVDGVDITRSSNTISDAITGVTFTLKKETTSSITLSVTNDTDTIKKNIESFVNAYNDVVNYVSTNSTYNSDTHTGGPLNGESTARNIINRLRNIVTDRAESLPENLWALSQIGISTNRDGTLSLNSSTLTDKFTSDLKDVANLFTDSSEGIANQVYDYVDDVTDYVDGAITVRVKGLQATVSDISDEIADFEKRLEKREENLRVQFTNLEVLLDSLNSQSGFLMNQLAMWQK